MGTTASIRVGSNLECISIVRSGNVLYTVLLGGSGFSVASQCNPDATSLVPKPYSEPYCFSNPGTNNAPFQSTILGTYQYQGGGAASGSGAIYLAAAAGLAAAAAVATLL